jgi:hypothetical protein
MTDAASLGVTPASNAASQIGLIYNSVFPSKNNASFIGGLSQDQTDLNVLSQLTTNVKTDYYTFNFEQGSAIKLAFNSTVGFLSNANNDPPGTIVDGVQSGLRFQLYDVTGNLLADSAGTDDQKTAYANLTSSTGLTAPPGGYYAQVSALPGTNLTVPQSYNLQFFSGTTYNTSFVSTAQTQAYDPNLFTTAASTVAANVGDLKLYTNTANLSGNISSALDIGNLEANKSELDVISQINQQNKAAYFKFDLTDGNSLKFTLNNKSLVPVQLRVQIFDSTGKKIIADSSGTEAQQEAYTKLASGQGLTAQKGTYTAKISYAPNSDFNSTQKFDFQLYSGTSYASVFKTTATLPDPSSASIPNVGIFADSQAQLFTRQAFHTIGETAASGVNIGWLSENKSRLDVLSQLTAADQSGFYNFTLQQGQNLKLAFQNTTNTANLHVQLLDVTGTQIIADNFGTDAQKKAYADLASTTGVKASPGQYSVRVGFATGATNLAKQTYNFQIYSGDTYLNSYRTTTSPQTYENAILSSNPKVVGYSPAAAAAQYFNNLANGEDSSIFDSLSTLV